MMIKAMLRVSQNLQQNKARRKKVQEKGVVHFESRFAVIADSFRKINLPLGVEKQRDTGWSKHFIKILLNTVHCICISFSCSN